MYLLTSFPRAYRLEKPRNFGMTEIRAPSYSTFGTRHEPAVPSRLYPLSKSELLAISYMRTMLTFFRRLY